MANVLTTNPIQLDAAGATSLIETHVQVSGIIVIANNDTWSCIIHDAKSGNVVFRADSALANHRSVYWAPAKPVSLSGLHYTTATNIALVLVYLA